MPLNADHSDLPPATPASGNPPTQPPIFMQILADAWYRNYLDETGLDKAHAEPTRIRNSWAGSCARDLGYKVALRDATMQLAELDVDSPAAVELLAEIERLQPTNPPDVASLYRMNIGTMIHEAIQGRLIDAFPGAAVEVTVDMRPIGLDSSGHVDVVVDEDRPNEDTQATYHWRTAIEIKSINGFGFKMATGCRGPAEGPRESALLQGALNALALNADELVIGYLSLENLSQREADKVGADEYGKFCAEWRYPRDVFEPLAQAEMKRMNAVLEFVDDDKLPPRSMPGIPKGARVIDPAKGHWVRKNAEGAMVENGQTWMCQYCWNRDRCIDDGPT